MTPRDALKKHWGYDAFHPLQEEAITAALGGRDNLVVLPTGGGKSVCFQVPAACSDGLVVVISPLIALMDDQVAGAREAGISAGAMHQNLDAAQKREVRQALEDGSLRLLYLSPERLVLGDLSTAIQKRLRLVAIDEAHCISHWGHDFRPEYRQIADILASWRKVPVMALTATATPQVQDDIVAQLRLPDPLRLVGSIDRPNLTFRALPREQPLEQMLAVIQRHPGEGGIVYAQTRKAVEQFADKLKAKGVDARAYHAGLDAALRSRTVADFTAERLQVVVATVAFGMGIDRSNVRFVIHAALPRSVEHYQQESGRAGRDGEPAECVLLWGGQDFATWRFLARQENTDPVRMRGMERQLAAIGRYASAPICRHKLLSDHFGQELAIPADGCGACDVCLEETAALPIDEALLTAKKLLSAVWRTGNRFGSGHVSKVLRGVDDEQIKRWGHGQLTVFGLMKDAHDVQLRRWLDQLIAQGHLVVDDGEYPTLALSEAGYALCKGEGEVRLDAPAPPRERKRKVKRGAAAAATIAAPADASLFERLRALRKQLAEKAGLPPYVIATDAGLRAVCELKPKSIEALALCHGWGEKRAARYGAQVIALISGQ